MEFTGELYETTLGRRPLREFLDAIKETDPDDFAAIMAGIAKLRNRQYHRLPLSKPIGNGLFELRHVGKQNARLLYFFAARRRVVIVHGIRNKSVEIPKRDREVALERREDWLLGDVS